MTTSSPHISVTRSSKHPFLGVLLFSKEPADTCSSHLHPAAQPSSEKPLQQGKRGWRVLPLLGSDTCCLMLRRPEDVRLPHPTSACKERQTPLGNEIWRCRESPVVDSTLKAAVLTSDLQCLFIYFFNPDLTLEEMPAHLVCKWGMQDLTWNG